LSALCGAVVTYATGSAQAVLLIFHSSTNPARVLIMYSYYRKTADFIRVYVCVCLSCSPHSSFIFIVVVFTYRILPITLSNVYTRFVLFDMCEEIEEKFVI
jgi:hypothetical protein